MPEPTASGAIKLDPPIEVMAWGTPAKHKFTRLDQFREWASREAAAWDIPGPSSPALARLVNPQKATYPGLVSAVDNYLSQWAGELSADHRENITRNFHGEVGHAVSRVTNGSVLTSEHPMFADIRALSDVDPTAAALLLIASADGGEAAIANLAHAQKLPWKCVITAALSGHRGLVDLRSALEHQVAALSTAGRRGDEAARAVEDFFERWQEKRAADDEEADAAKLQKQSEWDETLASVRDAWDARIKAYDEKMALAAPTTYWAGRQQKSAIAAVIYGLAFLALVTVGMAYFVTNAIPYLKDAAAPGVSIITAVLPVLVPTFAGVWLLRIVSRQLSESLQLMKDSSERVVMVKTFLALMNDEVRGKALVTDDDRLLILHSLFRPSIVSATDDAPPVHWFDILSKKFGGPDKR